MLRLAHRGKITRANGEAQVMSMGPPPDDPNEVRAAAANIVVHGFSPMLMDLVRRAHPMGLHQFQLITHDAANLAPGLAEDDLRVVLCSACIDVRHEPVVLRLPHTHGRYFNLMLTDAVGEPFESLGSRTGDDAGIDLALVGPDWRGELPKGVRARRVPSPAVWAVSRILAHSELDRPDAEKVAERLGIAVLKPDTVRRRSTTSVLEPPSTPCIRQVARLSPAIFLHRLEAVLNHAPAAYRDVERPLMDGLLRELGGPPDSAQWPDAFADAIVRGFADGMEAIQSAAAAASTAEKSGWRIYPSRFEETAPPHLARAARAFAGLGAPMREDVLTLICDRDETGRPLSGANTYRIHFPRTALPPANAFWQLAIRQDDGRGGPSLGSRGNMTPNADGSCDLHIGNRPPPMDQVGNWLPAPAGATSLVVRLFSPGQAALDGTWRMPPVQRVDPGSAVKRRNASSPLGISVSVDPPTAGRPP
jgi:hypothetical protein